MTDNEIIMKYWKEHVEGFGRNKALFWASRMSFCAKSIVKANSLLLSNYIELLDMSRKEYEDALELRVEKEPTISGSEDL